MEPALTNIGIVLPDEGYLAGVREITRRHGVLLVNDETHTICAGPGGATAAWDLDPDFVVIGKPIGGGIPVAAYGMSAEVAARLEGPMLGPRHRRRRRRRHAVGLGAGDGRGPRDAVDRAAPGGLRRRDPAGRVVHRRHPGSDRRAPASPGTSSASAAARSTGSARPRARAPRPRRRSTRSSTPSSTSGRSTAACCWRRSTTCRSSRRSTPRPTSTRTRRSSAARWRRCSDDARRAASPATCWSTCAAPATTSTGTSPSPSTSTTSPTSPG